MIRPTRAHSDDRADGRHLYRHVSTVEMRVRPAQVGAHIPFFDPVLLGVSRRTSRVAAGRVLSAVHLFAAIVIINWAYRYLIRMDLLRENRPNAMLTTADRRYLKREADPSDYADFQSWCRNRRSQIRERVSQSILDFHLVTSGLSAGDQLEIHFGQEEQLDSALHACFTEMMEFLSLRGPIEAEKIVEGGLERGTQDLFYIDRNEFIDCEVNVNIEVKNRIDVPTLVEKYERDEPLSADELRILYIADHISLNEFDSGLDSSLNAE